MATHNVVDLRTLILEVNNFLSYIASVDENYSLPKPMYAIYNIALSVFTLCVAISSSSYVYRSIEPILGLVKWRYLRSIIGIGS